MPTPIGTVVRGFLLRQGGSSGHPAQEQPDIAYGDVEPLVDTLGEQARSTRDAAEFRAVSSEIKSRLLVGLAQAPDYRVRDLVRQNTAMLARLADGSKSPDTTAAGDTDRLQQIGAKAVDQIADQADTLARQAVAMGLAAGAVDGVAAAVLGGHAGTAPEALRPAAPTTMVQRYLETLYDQPDKADQRLDFIKGHGTERLSEIVAHHVEEAQDVRQRMADADLSPAGFSDLKLHLFADSYHIGLNLALQHLPEANALAPRWDQGPAREISGGADAVTIGDIPLDVNW